MTTKKSVKPFVDRNCALMIIETELASNKDDIGSAIIMIFISMSFVIFAFLALRSLLGWVLKGNGSVLELDFKTSPLPPWDHGHET